MANRLRKGIKTVIAVVVLVVVALGIAVGFGIAWQRLSRSGATATEASRATTTFGPMGEMGGANATETNVITDTVGATSTTEIIAERLIIYPDSYIDAASCKIVLNVENKGTAAAVVHRIEVVGVANIVRNFTWGPTPTKGVKVSEVVIGPGAKGCILAQVDNCEFVPGTKYQIKIYTRANNVYAFAAVART